MKVLQVFDQTSPLVSGYSMRSRYLTDNLAQLGAKVEVVSSPIFSYKAQEENINGVTYKRTEVAGWNAIKKFPILKELLVVSSLKDKIQSCLNGEAKIIDAHSSVLNGMAACEVAKKNKLPFIYEIRALWEDAAVDQGKTKEGSLRYNLTRNMETDIIKKADAVTVICEGIKKDILNRGIKEEKITVIPNGVDVNLFQPMPKDPEILARYSLQGSYVIGFIGTFFLFEGLDILVKAAKEILVKNKNVKFLLVGGGEQEAQLKSLVEELNLQDHVIFSGRVKHDDVQKFYSVIDILVYPRTSKRITELVTPLKPLEAMALEKIVIGSNVGGIKELIKEGQNGLLFKAEDVQALAEKCLYAIENLSTLQTMAKQGREFVIKERNWQAICQRYFDIFKKLGVSV